LPTRLRRFSLLLATMNEVHYTIHEGYFNPWAGLAFGLLMLALAAGGVVLLWMILRRR
jgi:hypothetical protein